RGAAPPRARRGPARAARGLRRVGERGPRLRVGALQGLHARRLAQGDLALIHTLLDRLSPGTRAVLLWLLRLGVGGVFLITGALKITDPADFALQIHNYQLFPQLAPWLAATLPAVEIFAGAAVVAGPRVWVRAGALASGGLMTVFTIAVLS